MGAPMQTGSRRRRIAGSMIGVAGASFLAGILFWSALGAGVAATNTEAFCTSCHAMRDNAYAEFQGSIHDSNRTGVRATCADCHVPRDLVHEIADKVRASAQVYHALAGTIDTKEKFEARRQVLATRVWDTMRATQSRECRSCHAFESMSAGRQRPEAREAHERAMTAGKTCIDCHKGIAHFLPDEEATAPPGT
ncbi:MAG: NapC/NirT family cytochrome c [Steroidobacteraceae bacterium]